MNTFICATDDETNSMSKLKRIVFGGNLLWFPTVVLENAPALTHHIS